MFCVSEFGDGWMILPTRRTKVVPLVFALVCGCGGPSWDPGSVRGSFASIESAVDDVSSQINAAGKKKNAPRDLGSDSDRIGFTLSIFMKAAEGTPVQADAKDFEKKFLEMERLVGIRAPMTKIQEAMKQVQDSMATIKAKL